jgi:hypothetical protein
MHTNRQRRATGIFTHLNRLRGLPEPDAVSTSTSPRSALYTAIARHTVLVIAVLTICAITAALLRRRTNTARTRSSARRPAPASRVRG